MSTSATRSTLTAVGSSRHTPGTFVGGRGDPPESSSISASMSDTRPVCPTSRTPAPSGRGSAPAAAPRGVTDNKGVTTTLSCVTLSRLSDRIVQVLSDRYRLLAPIGTGASASVYLADD